jgi:hypothetical protein
MKLAKSLRTFGTIIAFIGIAATQSYALPANEIETTYYSDASRQAEVGYSFLGCDGSRYREGRTSRYKFTSTSPCNGNPPAEVSCYVYDVLTTCPVSLCNSHLPYIQCQ